MPCKNGSKNEMNGQMNKELNDALYPLVIDRAFRLVRRHPAFDLLLY